jgi:hypothetical protein
VTQNGDTILANKIFSWGILRDIFASVLDKKIKLSLLEQLETSTILN